MRCARSDEPRCAKDRVLCVCVCVKQNKKSAVRLAWNNSRPSSPVHVLRATKNGGIGRRPLMSLVISVIIVLTLVVRPGTITGAVPPCSGTAVLVVATGEFRCIPKNFLGKFVVLPRAPGFQRLIRVLRRGAGWARVRSAACSGRLNRRLPSDNPPLFWDLLAWRTRNMSLSVAILGDNCSVPAPG